MIILICSILLTPVCPPRARASTQYFIALLWRFAPTPLHFILSICTRFRRFTPLALRANSAPLLSLCAARFAHITGTSHPVLSTLHLFYGYILFVCAGLFCGLSDALL
jgi:hypothetical protein